MSAAVRTKTPPYTVQEAATFLKLRPPAIRDLCRRGLINYTTAARKWLLNGDDVENFVPSRSAAK